MAQPPNPDLGTPSAADGRRCTENQDTVLLTDVPEAAAPTPELPLPPSTLSTGHSNFPALTALSQRYEILAEAGHGSMGNVYKARDRETGEIVALKLLKPEIASDQGMIERFKNELLFARKITHKNVCRVYEFNRIGGIAFTSMEFVEGESLRSVLNRFGGLPSRKGLDLMLQICSGLTEAHAQGIVHRDLKPENVMIDAQGNVKIMDFGIARSMQSLTRLTGSMVGTPAYMAPEQVGGKPVDYRTDIYALGLIMYEVFTGAPAFQAENAVAVALKQMRESPVPPHEIEPTIPVTVERAILKCLEKEPSKRFQSIAEVASGLRATGGLLPGSVVGTTAPSHSVGAAMRPPSPQKSLALAPKRTSSVLWVLLGTGLVLLLLGGVRAAQLTKFAKNLPPPALAPEPPDFALEIPSAGPDLAQPSAAIPEASKPVDEEPVGPKPAAKPKSRGPALAAHRSEQVDLSGNLSSAKNQPEHALQSPTAGDVVQRDAGAFGKTQPAAAGVASQATDYVWVGRYESQDRAQVTAKKIEDHGLPVAVVPRHTERGDFFAVFTGPFGAKRVPSVLQWLQTDGFPAAHQVGGLTGTQNQNHRQNQNP
jgi:serine/threonine protein kinase